MRDMVNNMDVQSSIDPDDYTTTVSGVGIDLQGYNGAMIAFLLGTITDGTHTPSLEESDALGSGYAAVAAADMEGTLAAAASDTNQRVGYKGTKRYIRAVITVAGATTGAQAAAVIVRGMADSRPVA